jgi:tetraacyldisaccharide 4'-kinase
MDRSRWIVRCWEMLIGPDSLGWIGTALRWILSAAAAVYRSIVVLRNRGYDRGILWTHPASVPVVSIGNLSVGGSGKTPVTLWSARKLLEKGLRPVILSRGYGRTSGGAVVVVSDGNKILADARESGDEPQLLARKAVGVPVVVASDRTAGAAAALAFHPDCLLLDDGFQHRRLRRDADFVCLDEWILKAPAVFPRGVLREPAQSLSRARALIVKSGDREDFLRRFRETFGFDPGLPAAAFRYRAAQVSDRSGHPFPASELKGRKVLAFCGLAHPEGFEEILKECGAELAAVRRFSDHHAYSEQDLNALSEKARALGAELITTEKDAARIPAPFAVKVLEVELEWTAGEAELENILLETVKK